MIEVVRPSLKGPWLIALVACLLPLHATSEELSKDFVTAIRLFLKDDPKQSQEGERRIRRLGDQAPGQLRLWIEKADERFEKVYGLLAALDPDTATGGHLESPELRRFLLSRLNEGWNSLRQGDYKTAREIADGLLSLDGRSSRVFDYRRLSRAAEKRALAKEVLEPVVLFGERVYEVGDTPRVLFRLTNHRDEQMVVRTRGGILGMLRAECELRYLTGTTKTDVDDIPIPASSLSRVEQLVLPAKQAYEVEIPIPLDAGLADSGLVIRVRVSGRFRPSQWGVGNRNVNFTLIVPQTECWVVPKGERHLALSPLRKLEVARILRDTETFFVAGQLASWGATDDPLMKEKLLKLLVDSLPLLNDFGFQIANRLLIQASGVPKKSAVDAAFWREWMRRRQAKQQIYTNEAGMREEMEGLPTNPRMRHE